MRLTALVTAEMLCSKWALT